MLQHIRKKQSENIVSTYEATLQTENLKDIVLHVFETMKHNPLLVVPCPGWRNIFKHKQKIKQRTQAKTLEYLFLNFEKMDLQSASLTCRIVAMAIGIQWEREEIEGFNLLEELRSFIDLLLLRCKSMIHDDLPNEVKFALSVDV